MKTLTEQLRHHWMHAACAAAAVAAITAVAFGVPILGLLAVVFCGGMMISMVWMMVAMGRHRGSRS
jgi:uncharacterized membrane protein